MALRDSRLEDDISTQQTTHAQHQTNQTPPINTPKHHQTPNNDKQGHAIECRINAEDPFANFRPGPGRVTTYLAPGGPNVRMDSHLYPGYLVPPNYDSLLGKLIVWGEDRERAINRMLRALDETVITGVPTTGPFHKLILDHPAFRAGDVDTGFIPKHQDELTTPPPTSKAVKFMSERLKAGKAKVAA